MVPPQLSEGWLNILVHPPKERLDAKISIFEVSEMNDGSDAFPFVHKVKGIVDFFEWHRVSDEFIHLQFST